MKEKAGQPMGLSYGVLPSLFFSCDVSADSQTGWSDGWLASPEAWRDVSLSAAQSGLLRPCRNISEIGAAIK